MKGACLLLCAAVLLPGCYREQREIQGPPPAAATQSHSALAAAAPANLKNRYEDNAVAVSQGKKWYRAYNCAGCHGQGGGNIGPALMDSKWLYGSDPASIFTTISAGRPNGMPAFGAHVPEDQIWQLAAYVRSMSGQLRTDVAPSRSDALQASEPEGRREPEARLRDTPQTEGKAAAPQTVAPPPEQP